QLVAVGEALAKQRAPVSMIFWPSEMRRRPSSPHMLSHSFSHSWYADIASGTERALVSCRGSLNANSASDVARANQSRLMSWKVSSSSFCMRRPAVTLFAPNLGDLGVDGAADARL